MKKNLLVNVTTAMLFFIGTVGMVNATPITVTDLTGLEAVEDFEDLPTGPTLTPWFKGWRTPADGYHFDSGVSFNSLSPPNRHGDIIIGDKKLGRVGFGTSDGGGIGHSTPLPSGDAFIADDGPR